MAGIKKWIRGKETHLLRSVGKNDELTKLEIAKEIIEKITNSFQMFIVFMKIGKAKIVTALLKMTNVILIILNLR